MDLQTLQEMARHQAWADSAHWTVIRETAALREDSEIRTRLNHMLSAMRMLTMLARGQTPDFAAKTEMASVEELEAAMGEAHTDLIDALQSVDLNRSIALPRGPKGPFEAPAGVLLLQAITHSQYHRGQNALRIRQLGPTPPTTDFGMWYALGRPS